MTHAHFLRSQGADYRAAGRALANGDIALAELSPTDRLMLAYAEKLTREPASISDDDIHGLRDGGALPDGHETGVAARRAIKRHRRLQHCETERQDECEMA